MNFDQFSAMHDKTEYNLELFDKFEFGNHDQKVSKMYTFLIF